ncbi:hypothetical protein [Bacteroides sp.]|uniref:hypothetical protein n=1 Tax=Bacteroides sp. TaxID=29523 RepID=UPI002630B4E2|nr:hypothetical protein [Bacteroides sp.]MDD3039026.1 hypothetical protein [Bacteroides sp.]
MKLTTLYRQIMNRIAREIEPEIYRMFQLHLEDMPYQKMERIFNNNGFYYNDLSIRFKNQLYTCRLVEGDHQMHLRVYNDGWVTGHYELASFHGSDHLRGVDYRPLLEEEISLVRGFFSPMVIVSDYFDVDDNEGDRE